MLEWAVTAKQNDSETKTCGNICDEITCSSVLDSCTDLDLLSSQGGVATKLGSCDSCNAVAGTDQAIRYI